MQATKKMIDMLSGHFDLLPTKRSQWSMSVDSQQSTLAHGDYVYAVTAG